MGAEIILRALVVCALLSACASADRPESRHVVYLNFADGTEGIRLGADDDATNDTSRLCATPVFAPWVGAEGCGDRDACRAEISRRVAAYYATYDIAFVTQRPSPDSTYAMIVVAPPNDDCTFGERGVSYADCGNANPSSVAFVFDCDRDVDACAVLIAHETAHTLGLVHVTSDADVMTIAPFDARLQFSNAELPAPEGACGVTSQNDHDLLLATLGPARH